ncbi:MAG: hypothetical protein IJ685_02230 [Selenomonadaceae bacterium]|nr:hypothetical protein [Selenomonadaceae bacterium]
MRNRLFRRLCVCRRQSFARLENIAESLAAFAGSYLRHHLGAPYRTVQNWFNGTRQPVPWLERLVVKEIQAAAE